MPLLLVCGWPDFQVAFSFKAIYLGNWYVEVILGGNIGS